MIETDANFEWFYQPPINGNAGLIMIVDKHPGPDHAEAKFVFEVLDRVLLKVESGLPGDLSLPGFSIYVKDHSSTWLKVEFPYALSRRFQVVSPDHNQAKLSELWDQRKRYDTSGGLQ